MAHFAKVKDGIVIKVIVAEQEFVDNYIDNEPGIWVQTSYNGSIRKNYAGIGYTYDPQRDAFIPPKQYESWILNEDTCLWEPPIAYPTDGKIYKWNENNQSWDEIE
tara:strand:- start:771 stop:1088 length:318 start_codon:yes stop_codon:yes gene_type:complete